MKYIQNNIGYDLEIYLNNEQNKRILFCCNRVFKDTLRQWQSNITPIDEDVLKELQENSQSFKWSIEHKELEVLDKLPETASNNSDVLQKETHSLKIQLGKAKSENEKLAEEIEILKAELEKAKKTSGK